MTVKEMLRRIDSPELTEWMEYEKQTGPLGGARLDILTAILAATISNGFRGLAGKRGARKLDGFMPKWDKHREQLSPEQMLEKVRAINRELGGREVTR